MGMRYTYECTKCKYHISIDLGVGFMFPKVYNDFIEDAKKGKFGNEIREFLDTFPEGAIDIEPVVVVCEKCRNIEVVQDLSMYIPKKGIAKEDDIIPWSMENYDLFKKSFHKCSKCSGHSNITSHDKLKCPKCKIPLLLSDCMFWD